MEMFRASPAEPAKGWFGWGSSQPVIPAQTQAEADAASVPGDNGLVATLRNVFVPTPNPDLAPQHPVDPVASSTGSPASSVSDKSVRSKKDGKLVDYINTLEISSPADKSSKEAVVVLHGYAAAMG